MGRVYQYSTRNGYHYYPLPPIRWWGGGRGGDHPTCERCKASRPEPARPGPVAPRGPRGGERGFKYVCVYICTDRKSTRLNSSHHVISSAVLCLKKNKITNT